MLCGEWVGNTWIEASSCTAFPVQTVTTGLLLFEPVYHLPGNDQLCKEAVCFFQNVLLGNKHDMDDIANAILKIYENRDKLVSSRV